MTSHRPFSVAGRRVTVVGAARSGIAAAELLVRRGASVTLTDLRETLPDETLPDEARLREAGVDLELGGHRESTFTGADLIVTSPGVPARQPALDAARRLGVEIIGELELAWRWLRGPVVAITGTKGKSTTSTLTGRMLEAGGRRVLVGGNIGLALSAQVEASTEDTIHVVEVSSFQLETTSTFRPWIAVLLNFSPDHLDRHAGVEEYAAAKARVFANQSTDDWAVLNADDPASLGLAAGIRARQARFSMETGSAEAVVIDDGVIVRQSEAGRQALVPLSSVRLIGRHLVADVMAAAAVASIAGVEPGAMVRAVEGFTGLEHALERVGDVGGVRFINDSKATNIEAARRAVESLGEGLVVILGGRFKGGDFGELRELLRARRASVVAIGEARPLITAALRPAVPVHEAEDMSTAVRTAFASASPGHDVVLAPACSSFDMFSDYAERGRAFKREVRRLEEEWNVTREQ